MVLLFMRLPAAAPIPAAQYLRMSTEHQLYSFVNQRKAIQDFAQRNGYRVVSSYEDAGKSGLALRHRQGLQTLLNDVVSGSAPFQIILVYDVSRWGRFQDCDEAAHYEFLCRSSGVDVHYCVEEFANDGSTSSSILKSLKRSMAGEYSRELSNKVFAAQRRLALSGFRPGSSAGYGLRRMAISASGKPIRELSPGEMKPFVSDHVTLVPGPEKELAVLRRIYYRFIRARGTISTYDIARELNNDGIPAVHGGAWSPFLVRKVLKDPKYTGTLVWARTTQRLLTNPKRKPTNEWVIKEQAYEPIIDRDTFEKAQEVFQWRATHVVSEEDLLRGLKRILARYGRISEALVNQKTAGYALSTYQKRFGSMRQVYQLLGCSYQEEIFLARSRGEDTVDARNRLVLRILQRYQGRLSLYRVPHSCRRANLLLDDKFRLYVWMAKRYSTPSGKRGWLFYPAPKENDGLVLLCAMSAGSQHCSAMYLLPPQASGRTKYSFAPGDSLPKDAHRLVGMSKLCIAACEMLEASPRLRTLIELTEAEKSATRERNKKRRPSEPLPSFVRMAPKVGRV